jgi:ATP-binding cassette subfamily C protein
MPIIAVLSEILLMAGIGIALLIASPAATLISVAVAAPLVLLLLRLMRRGMARVGEIQHETTESTLRLLQESLFNLRDIRVLSRETFFEARFNERRSEMARSLYLRGLLTDVPRTTIETALVLVISAFLVITVYLRQDIDQGLAVLGVFAYAGIRLLPSLNRVVTGLNNLGYAQVSVEKVRFELRRIDDWTRDARRRGSVRPLTFEHKLELIDVGFSFDNGSPSVLQEIRITLPRGRSLGIVGTTGAGKSTLVDIIIGLLEPSTGTITVDGTSIHEVIPSWHAALGVVPQSPFLLDDTIRRNIALGIDEEEMDEFRIQEAVRIAQLEGFLGDLEDGLDTVVGERGVRLSGGERQRVAIARALYRDPEVLIFDEATSALDNVTESALMEAVEGIGRARTLIMVAHRMTSLRRCDHIVVLEKGRIVDSGRYEELAGRSALFGDSAPQT